ncbi:ROK family transcriptional regulator [Dermacoccaceae bacterium W4C1]
MVHLVLVTPTHHRTGSPGSQTALRERNRRAVLHALVSGPCTQADLGRHTGLSGATISNIVRALTEDGAVITEPTTSSGRRAVEVRLNIPQIVVAGIDIGRRHVRVVLSTPGYEILGERVIDLPLGHAADVGMDAAVGVYQELLAENGIDPASVAGAGVGLPGPIESATGVVLDGTILPEWVGIDVATELQRRLGVPTLVDNDANLGARAEVTWGSWQGVEDLIFVKVGTGVGAGLIVDGALHYGAQGIAGEIGHTTVDERGVTCRCGNRGCLETYASTTVMIEALRASREILRTQDIVDGAREGDPPTLRVLDDAGFALGRVVATLANFMNPQVVVIGGPLSETGQALLGPVHRGFVKHAIPATATQTRVVVSDLGDRAEALGAVALLLQSDVLAASLPSLFDGKAR